MADELNVGDLFGSDFSDPMPTERPIHPEYEGPAKVVKYDGGQSTKTKDGKEVTYRWMNITWQTESEEAKEAMKTNSPRVRQFVMLQTTEDGKLDKAANWQLGQVREALGQNTPGESWHPDQMIGHRATIRVVNRNGNRGKPEAAVTMVSPLDEGGSGGVWD